MTFHDDLVSSHFFIDPEWQSSPSARSGVRRVAVSREGPLALQYEAGALTTALRLDTKPAFGGVARKIAGTYAIPYDILVARMRRRKRAISNHIA
jgi:hypothetical protein